MAKSEAPFGTVDGSYWETAGRSRSAVPERDLMRAVLKASLLDFMRRCGKPDARFREAREWLFDRNDDSLFAFESVCEVLRLRPGKIRAGLLEWMREKRGIKSDG